MTDEMYEQAKYYKDQIESYQRSIEFIQYNFKHHNGKVWTDKTFSIHARDEFGNLIDGIDIDCCALTVLKKYYKDEIANVAYKNEGIFLTRQMFESLLLHKYSTRVE